MGPSIIARNYAETLLTLARKHGGDSAVDEFGAAIDQVATLLREEPRVREFLETPRIGPEAKKQAIRATFSGRVPEHFLRFLLIVLEKRRQTLLGAIAEEYHALVNEARNRVKAEISLARQPTPEVEKEVVSALEQKLGKSVVPTFKVDPEIGGGIVVRVGGRVMDGSVRGRLAKLRRALLDVQLPDTAAATQG